MSSNVVDFNKFKARNVQAEEVSSSSIEKETTRYENCSMFSFQIANDEDVFDCGNREMLSHIVNGFEDYLNDLCDILYGMGYNIDDPEDQEFLDEMFDQMQFFIMNLDDSYLDI